MAESSTALLLISDREPLAWLLRASASLCQRAVRLQPQTEELDCSTTQPEAATGTGHGPGPRDGLAIMTCQPQSVAEPVHFRYRDFHVGFRVRIEGLADPHDGVELGLLAGQLDASPDPATWSVRMRRPLIPLSHRDASLLVNLLKAKLRDREDVLHAYLDACEVIKLSPAGAS